MFKIISTYISVECTCSISPLIILTKHTFYVEYLDLKKLPQMLLDKII